MLARTHRSFHHRVGDLQVRRVERQGQVHRPARGVDVGREALVVLDVAGEQRVVMLALELAEQILRHLAQRIHQHVQAAPVGHAEHQFLHPGLSRALQQVVEHRDQRLAALQREALLPDVARMQVALQSLGRGEALQDVLLVVGREARLGAHRLQALLDPAFLDAAADVHVLDAQRAAVGLLQPADDLAQRRLLRPHQGGGIEHRAHVGVGQVVVARLEFRDVRLLLAPERIEIGEQAAAETVLGDQLDHRDLLAVKRGRGRQRPRGARPGSLREGIHHRSVGHVLGRGARQQLQLVEVAAPFLRHAGRIFQVLLVQLLDERGVPPEQIRVVKKLLHHGGYLCPIGFTSRRTAPL